MATVNEVLRDLERNHFYGSLEVKLEAGKVVLPRKTETIKPEPDDHWDNQGD